MITIKHSQKKIKIDVARLKIIVPKILEIIGYSDFDLGIWLTTNQTIKKYNMLYRKKDKPTDILSFPYHTDIKAGQKIKPQMDEDKNLGDIIISLEYAQSDAKKMGISLKKRLIVLLVHGICHLIGYDHISEVDYKKMHAKEQAILKQLM